MPTPLEDEKCNASHPLEIHTPAQIIAEPIQPRERTADVEKKGGVTGGEGDQTAFPRGTTLFVILVALGLVNLLVSIDQSIVATAIPKITDDFHDVAAIGWYGSAYILSVASCQMLYGRIFTLLPIKNVFLAAILIFEVGSIICGAAPNSDALIVGRTIAGIGGAGVWQGILVIIAHTVPLRLRPAWAALDSITFGLGSVTGPLIGGAFTDGVSWRWCFYINAPLGGVAGLAVAFLMPKIGRSPDNSTPGTGRRSFRDEFMRFDPFGLITIVIAMVFLLLALQYGGSQYSWSNGRIVAFLVIFALFAVAFIVTQIFGDRVHRAIPRDVALQRTVISASLYFFCTGGSFMLTLYFLPIWFQAVQGDSAFISGVKTIPLMLAYVASSVVSGIAITKVGYYSPFIILSSVLLAVGAGLISTLHPSSSTGAWIGYQVLFGLGLGLGGDIPFVAVQTVLPLDLVPSATAVLGFFQTIGATVFVSVAQSVFTNNAIGPLANIVPGTDPLKVLNNGITDLRTKVDSMVWGEIEDVLNGALDSVFLVGAIMAALSFIGAIGMEHKSVRKDETAKTEEQEQEQAQHEPMPSSS